MDLPHHACINSEESTIEGKVIETVMSLMLCKTKPLEAFHNALYPNAEPETTAIEEQ